MNNYPPYRLPNLHTFRNRPPSSLLSSPKGFFDHHLSLSDLKQKSFFNNPIKKSKSFNKIYWSKLKTNEIQTPSKTNRMQIFVFNRISEHLSLSFLQNTVVHMWTRSQIVINTCWNCFNHQSYCLISCHVILVLCFENSHCLQWTWTHRSEWQVGVTELTQICTFLQR